MEPAYRMIEFCRRPDTAWGKLREGRWDWLGVRADGQFVLGSPPRPVISDSVAATVLRAGAPEGLHGVRIVTEPKRESSPSCDWYNTPEDARSSFNVIVDEWGRKAGPMLARLQLVLAGKQADEVFVVNLQPTYGVWRPPPG